jgi:hypothetical protein
MLPASTTMRRFRYYFDPVPLTALAIYFANRWLFKPLCGAAFPFLRDYLNDVLCIPLFLPPVLLIHRLLRIRLHDRPPTAFELLFHLAVWSVCFEVVAPALPQFFRTTADPLDVAAYAVGAGLAGLIWGSWRRRAPAGISLRYNAHHHGHHSSARHRDDQALRRAG